MALTTIFNVPRYFCFATGIMYSTTQGIRDDGKSDPKAIVIPFRTIWENPDHQILKPKTGNKIF